MKKLLFFHILLFILILTPSFTRAADGAIDSFFLTGNGFSAAVRDFALQPDGRLVVVGEFTSIVGAPLNRIARLDSSGRLDFTFNTGGTGANGDIYTIKLLPDGKMLIGGNFTSYNGMPINRIARLNADGTPDTTFSVGTGANLAVYQIILQPDNRILIAGGFTTVNGSAKRAVARLLDNGNVDQTFTFTAPLEFNDAVRALALQSDGKILLGGFFFNGNNGQNNNLARLDSSGNLDTAFTAQTNVDSNTPVRSIFVLPSGKFLIGGQFSQVNGVQRVNLALLNNNGTLDNSFNATNVNRVLDIDVQADGKIILAGRFQRSSNTMTLERLHPNGAIDTSFNPNEPSLPTEINTVMSLPDNKIFAGGILSRNPVPTGSIPTPHANPAGVRRFNIDGTRDNSYLTRTGAVSNGVFGIAVQSSGKIVIQVGSDATVGGFARNRFARLNADGTVDENYAPTLSANAFATLPDNSLLVGAVSLPDTGTRFIRRINPDGSTDPSFLVEVLSVPNAFGSLIADMAGQPDGKTIVVGDFNSIGGIARKSIARLNFDGSVDTSFNSNLNFNEAEIRRVRLMPDGRMWISGRFNPALAESSVFRLKADGTAEAFTQANHLVNDIAYLNDGKAYICGDFTSVTFNPVKYVARINQDGTVDNSFIPPTLTGPNGNVSIQTCLAQADGKVIIGGEFISVNGITRWSIARLNQNGSLDTGFIANLTNGNSIYASARQPDGKILLGGVINSINGVPKNGIARLLRVSKPPAFDYDGDGKADLSVFRPSAGSWYISQSSNNAFLAVQFGASGDLIAPADFDGDGKTDICVFRPSDGGWYRLNSSNNTFSPAQFGTNGDLPVPGDFDGDGRADLTVYRPSAGSWYRINSSNNQFVAVQFGIAEDKPVVGDFDGDGKSDLTVFRPSNGTWYRINSASDTFSPAQFGALGDLPVAADFDGDGKTDLAVYRPSAGDWYIINSSNASFTGLHFGVMEDKPAPADFEGDGKADLAVFRPSTGTWYLLRTTSGFTGFQFGATGDMPTPNAYVR